MAEKNLHWHHSPIVTGDFETVKIVCRCGLEHGRVNICQSKV